MAQLDLSQIKTRVNAGLIRIRDIPSFSGITVCCYTEKVQYEHLWDEYTSMARGLVFSYNGKILSRPFKKFFNLGEVDENSLDWDGDIEISEKLDGSLIVVSFHNGAMILNSKCSFDSEHAVFAKKWIEEHLSKWYERECYYSSKIERDLTFCFEAIFPDGRIVIDYGNLEQLVLLSIIHTDSGKECRYDDVKSFADYYDIPIVKRHVFDSTEDFVDTVRGRPISEGEGVVIRFVNSNTRVKVKSDEYVKLHRLISHMSEKHIWDVLMSGGDISVIYSTLPDELYEEVKKITKDLMDEYSQIEQLAFFSMYELNQLKTRREKAVFINEHPDYKKISGVLFIILDGRDPKDAIWKVIRTNMIARSKPEDVS
jgi:T4 RnlA family RNA ligase